MNSDHEEITLSQAAEISPQLDIKTNINKDGVEMIGYDTIENYLHILRSLLYINRKPAYYLNRVFKLSCSQLGDQFHSAEFTLTLTVLHPKQSISTEIPTTTEKIAVPVREHDNSNIFNRVLLHPQEVSEPHLKTSHNIMHNNGATHSTMLIVVICVSFVMLICGVGIARLRNQTQVSRGKNKHQTCAKVSFQGVSLSFMITTLIHFKNPTDQQLDWDDGNLTITINPMQNDNLTDDSSDSENSDSDDEEGET